MGIARAILRRLDAAVKADEARRWAKENHYPTCTVCGNRKWDTWRGTYLVKGGTVLRGRVHCKKCFTSAILQWDESLGRWGYSPGR